MKKNYCKIILFMVITITLLGSSAVSSISLEHKQKLDSKNTDWWSQFRHDASHTAYSTSSAPNTNTILWNYSPSDYTTWLSDSSPVVVDGKVYIGASSDLGMLPKVGFVYCLDEFSGQLIWSRQTAGWVFSSPAVNDNKVYVGSMFFITSFKGTFYCLDSNDGSILWNYASPYAVYSSPAISNGKVYFGSTDLDSYNSKGEIVCLDSNDGNLIWKYLPEKGVLSSPAISNDKLYFGCMDGKVYCLDAENGDVLWNYNTGARIRSSPTIYENKVYIGSLNGKVYCLNAEDGGEFWNYIADGEIGASPAVGYGNVYIGTHFSSTNNKGSFYCLDAFTGNQIWNFTTDLSIVSSAGIADSKVYIGLGGSFNASIGNITCLNALNGENIWIYSTNRPVMGSPSICNNKLYINSYEGSLYCFCDGLPPEKPSRPQGPATGKIGVFYDYSTNSTDPNDDMVRYGWDWNSDKVVDEWTSFYESGATVTTSHSWEKSGTHIVRVRAEDTAGIQSEWSDPLVVIMPKSQIFQNIRLIVFFKEIINNAFARLVYNYF